MMHVMQNSLSLTKYVRGSWGWRELRDDAWQGTCHQRPGQQLQTSAKGAHLISSHERPYSLQTAKRLAQRKCSQITSLHAPFETPFAAVYSCRWVMAFLVVKLSSFPLPAEARITSTWGEAGSAGILTVSMADQARISPSSGF
jgi:hypothetical protein